MKQTHRSHHSEPIERIQELGLWNVSWLTEEQEPWQAVLVHDLEFPLALDQIKYTEDFFRIFDAEVLRRGQAQPETFLQFSHLHVGDCARLLTERARVWQPRMGLGVYPDQPPPRLWNAEDFHFVPSENATMRPLMNTVLRMSDKVETQTEVVQQCAVSGAVMRFYSQDFRAFLKASKEQLLPRLTESAHQGFLFYLPVLNAASFRSSKNGELDAWLPGVEAYFAQSHEDRGLVVAYRGDLAAVLHPVADFFRKDRAPKSRETHHTL